ncbi:hypothetical protein F4779DRAFT_613207 [Xylariaceae sp. FL0662B]|nr:hypothetical protein F4779DRAFT_613207 [Xylariaceae sp. FL0662B]
MDSHKPAAQWPPGLELRFETAIEHIRSRIPQDALNGAWRNVIEDQCRYEEAWMRGIRGLCRLPQRPIYMQLRFLDGVWTRIHGVLAQSSPWKPLLDIVPISPTFDGITANVFAEAAELARENDLDGAFDIISRGSTATGDGSSKSPSEARRPGEVSKTQLSAKTRNNQPLSIPTEPRVPTEPSIRRLPRKAVVQDIDSFPIIESKGRKLPTPPVKPALLVVDANPSSRVRPRLPEYDVELQKKIILEFGDKTATTVPAKSTQRSTDSRVENKPIRETRHSSTSKQINHKVDKHAAIEAVPANSESSEDEVEAHKKFLHGCRQHGIRLISPPKAQRGSAQKSSPAPPNGDRQAEKKLLRERQEQSIRRSLQQEARQDAARRP